MVQTLFPKSHFERSKLEPKVFSCCKQPLPRPSINPGLQLVQVTHTEVQTY